MYRRANPSFTNWVPKTAYEAVDRFTRCQSNGLKALMFPECLIECSKGLPDAELDKFEDWIINPQGLDYSKAVPDSTIAEANTVIFKEAEKRQVEDEKMPDADDDVEMKVQDLGNGEIMVGPVSSQMAAMAVCGLL